MSDRASTEAGSPRTATERLRANEAGLARAAALLAAGRLVALPTETVYGLGADGRNAAAVAALYAAKGRPRFNPLIAHLADVEAARREGVLDGDAIALAAAFWPGPLTLVVPASPTCRVSDLARAGLVTVALRVPAHPVARELIARSGAPVVAPSANRSGGVSPTNAAHVLVDLDGRIDAVVDAGPCPVGLESTIVACLPDGPRLLRPGGIERAAIERVLGRALTSRHHAQPIAPGALRSHYAPLAPVRLGATSFGEGEAALLFGPEPAGLAEDTPRLNLSRAGDLAEAAANLFGHLRALDARAPAAIAVAPVPDLGLGEAINDRLRRAAAER